VASPLENLRGPGRALQKETPDAKEFAGFDRAAVKDMMRKVLAVLFGEQ